MNADDDDNPGSDDIASATSVVLSMLNASSVSLDSFASMFEENRSRWWPAGRSRGSVGLPWRNEGIYLDWKREGNFDEGHERCYENVSTTRRTRLQANPVESIPLGVRVSREFGATGGRRTPFRSRVMIERNDDDDSNVSASR